MKRAGGKAALQMAEEILGAVDHHRNGASASDDLTVLVVRRD
jgi:serine phosphatase RsbU (regulator of sigma subunit)